MSFLSPPPELRFYLDENFPVIIGSRLAAAGHRVFRAIDLHPRGTADEILFRDAQSKAAIFLTTDKDFFHTVPFLFPQRKAPVVAITLARANTEAIWTRLVAWSTSISESDMTAIFLVKDTRILRRE